MAARKRWGHVLTCNPFRGFIMAIKDRANNNAGFTLIELAVVMVIVGIIISIMATVLPSLIQSAKIRKARAILEKADYALDGFLAANGLCP